MAQTMQRDVREVRVLEHRFECPFHIRVIHVLPSLGGEAHLEDAAIDL